MIDFLPDQNDEVAKGSALRLGAYPYAVRTSTQMYHGYGKIEISERHRHCYEFNKEYRKELSDAGLVVSGISQDEYIVGRWRFRKTISISTCSFTSNSKAARTRHSLS